MTLKVIELFAGIGAQAQALKRAGIDHEVIAISEIDPYAIRGYEAINGPVNNLGDITKIEHLPPCDILTNSSPCQDISISGKQEGLEEGSGTRSALIWEVIRLLKDMKERDVLPKYIITENVKALSFKKNRPAMYKYMSILKDLGYKHTTWDVMKASDYGIPQGRERVIMVSSLEGVFVFPPKTKCSRSMWELLDDDVDEKYYLKDELIKSYEEHKKRQIENGRGFGWSPKEKDDRIMNTITTKPSRNGSGNYIVVTGSLKKKGWIDHVSRVYSPDGICPTITTCQGGGHVPKVKVSDEPLRIRVLTPTECLRFMDFDEESIDKLKATGMSDTRLYKMAGNSIPVGILVEVFKRL